MPEDTHGIKWCADDETPESVGRAFPALFLNPMKSRKKITFKFVPSLIVQAQKMEKMNFTEIWLNNKNHTRSKGSGLE